MTTRVDDFGANAGDMVFPSLHPTRDPNFKKVLIGVMSILTRDQVDKWRCEGFVVVDGLLEASLVDAVADAAQTAYDQVRWGTLLCVLSAWISFLLHPASLLPSSDTHPTPPTTCLVGDH